MFYVANREKKRSKAKAGNFDKNDFDLTMQYTDDDLIEGEGNA